MRNGERRVAPRRRKLGGVVARKQRRALPGHGHQLLERRQRGVGGRAADGVDVGAAEQRARRGVRVGAGDRPHDGPDQPLRLRFLRVEQAGGQGEVLQAGDVAGGCVLLAAAERRAVDPGDRQVGALVGEVLVVVGQAEVAAAADDEELGPVERGRPLPHVGRRVDQRAVGSVELAGDRGRLVEHHEHLHVAQGVVDLVGWHRGVGIVGRADRRVHRGQRAVGNVDAAAVDGGVEAVGDPAAVAIEGRQVVGGEQLADPEVAAVAIARAARRSGDECALLQHGHLAAANEPVAGAQQQGVGSRGQVEVR